jgi:hypothetical protein
MMSLAELEREVGEHGEILDAHGQRLGRIESCLDNKDDGGGIAQVVLQIAADMAKSRNAGLVQVVVSVFALLSALAAAAAAILRAPGP